MFYTYVLRSKKDGELYIGSTNNLSRRFKEHNTGQVQSTKSRYPLMLVYYEAYSAEDDAREREHQLKSRGQARHQLLKRVRRSLLQHFS